MHALHAESIEVEINQDAPSGASSFFPASPGVVVFRSAEGRSVLISSASDMRSFIGDRLGGGQHSPSTQPNAKPSTRVDLRDVARSVRGYKAGIGLETRWVLSRLAKAEACVQTEVGRLYAQLVDQAMVHFLCPLDEPIRWAVVDSSRLIGLDTDAQLRCVGPFSRKGDAEAIIAALDDGFSLCRYPKELAQAPKGTACAYKDMGKCPAPCDGSEPVDSMQARFEKSIALIARGVEAGITQCQGSIEKASQRMEFEQAATNKRLLDAFIAVRTRSALHTRGLLGFSALVFAPSVRKGWAGVWVMGERGLRMIAVIEEAATREHIGEVLLAARSHREVGRVDDLIALDLGLIAREVSAKPGRGRRRVSTVFDLRDEIQIGEMHKAIVHAANANGDDSGADRP